MSYQETEFQECASCAAKAGSPYLCASCLHNRTAISILEERLERAEKIIKIAAETLSLKA